MKLTSRVAMTALVVLIAGCAWTQGGGNAGRTSYNDFGGLDPATAGTLHEVWHTRSDLVALAALDGELAFGRTYETSTAPARLEAYSAQGSERCSGSPRVCDPIWVADIWPDAFDPDLPLQAGLPVIADGYIAITHKVAGLWRLSLFDRRGVVGCQGASPRVCSDLGYVNLGFVVGGSTPSLTVSGEGLFAVGRNADQTSSVLGFKVADLVGCAGGGATCNPFMRAPADGFSFAPAFADGRMYVPTASGTNVFDATGVQGCVSGTCSPLWSYPTATGYSVAVGHGRLAASSGGSLSVFDAAGSTGCSGSPRICGPLFVSGPSSFAVKSDGPMIAGHLVVAYRLGTTGQEAAAFDLDALPDCTATSASCPAVWRVPTVQAGLGLAGAANVGISSGTSGGVNAPMVVFRLDGVGCHPTTHVCPPVASLMPAAAGTVQGISGGRVILGGIGHPAAIWAVQ